MRTDTYAQLVTASPGAVFRAFTNPEAICRWRPPKGMSCHIYQFEAAPGGRFRIAYRYDNAADAHGKTSEHEDVFHGHFATIEPDKRIVEVVAFESDDPGFAGEMTITTTLEPKTGGTLVTFVCENVPPGISAEDHEAGMRSSLENLQEYLGL